MKTEPCKSVVGAVDPKAAPFKGRYGKGTTGGGGQKPVSGVDKKKK